MGSPKQSPQPMERPVKILSASLDPGLNQARALVLQHHGFHVTTSESVEHARAQIQNNRFDVLIFGSTLPSDTCWQLAEIFRKSNAKGKIIEIIPAPWSAPKNRPDATVVSSDGATALVSTIHGGLAEL